MYVFVISWKENLIVGFGQWLSQFLKILSKLAGVWIAYSIIFSLKSHKNNWPRGDVLEGSA